MSQTSIWNPEQAPSIALLEKLEGRLRSVADHANRAYNEYNWAKGRLNEHQYEGKMLAAKDCSNKLAKVIAEQERNRALYESFRLKLVLSRRKLDEVCKALQSEMQQIKNAVVTTSPNSDWFTLAYNSLILWNQVVSARSRIIERVTEDHTDGQGKVALRKIFELACTNQPTGFEFCLAGTHDHMFWPVWSYQFSSAFADISSESIDSLNKAWLRLETGNESGSRFIAAKGRLNEPQFRQRLQAALTAGDTSQVEDLRKQQKDLRLDYIGTVLQGLHSWKYIDSLLTKLKQFIAEAKEQIAASKNEEEVAVIMINYVAAYLWVGAFQNRSRYYQFNDIVQEQNSLTALTALRDEFLALDTNFR